MAQSEAARAAELCSSGPSVLCTEELSLCSGVSLLCLHSNRRDEWTAKQHQYLFYYTNVSLLVFFLGVPNQCYSIDRAVLSCNIYIYAMEYAYCRFDDTILM